MPQPGLDTIIETHQRQVYSLAMAIMRNPSDAADMTQETFVRVMRSLGTFQGDERSFGSWLHRLTVNVCLDGLRRRHRGLASLDAHAEDVEAEPVSTDRWLQPESAYEWHESAREVHRALARLPVAQRVALTLHYFEDNSYEDIAAAMGVPLNTVKSHIRRGKARMAAA